MNAKMDHFEAMRVIKAFMDANRVRYGIEIKTIDEIYRIDHRKFEIRLKCGLSTRDSERKRAAKHESVREQFVAFAQDIQRDPSGVVAKLTGQIPVVLAPQANSPQALLDLSTKMGASEDTAAAVGLAKMAIRCAVEQGVDDIASVLPGALYMLHRKGSLSETVGLINRYILPWCGAHRHCVFPRSAAAAAIGQLACVLNEGRAHQAAMGMFARSDVRKLADTAGALSWCGPMILRNEAHGWVWHDHTLARAIDVAESAAQHDPSPANQQSVANTRCEIYIAGNENHKAWDAIGAQYSAVKRHLETHYDPRTGECVGVPVPRYQHSFGTLYLGACVRLANRDRKYLSVEAEHDAVLLEHMLGLDEFGIARRPMPLGGLNHAPVSAIHRDLATRFERISRIVVKPRATREDIAAIVNLADELSRAAGR